jgi:hypothetical protein
MIPAGLVDRVDPEERKVYLRATKDDVKKAPDYDPNRRSEEQRDDVDARYAA